MTVPPFTPGQFERLIIQEDDTLCTALNRLTQLSTMWWGLQKFKYEVGGNGFTDAYAALIEAALEACPDPSVPFDGIVPNPQEFKNFLLSPSSIFCEKFVKLASGLSQKLYELVAFEWNESGTDFSDEFKALLCGVDCAEPEVIDPNYILNYTRFIKWDVVSGAVDLIGLEPYHPVASGTGLYVDMHGTVDEDHTDVELSVMRTKSPAYAFEVEAGKSYRITYKLAGNNIASFVPYGTTRVRLLKASDNSQYESVDATHTASAWNMAFTTQTVNFTAGTTETVVLQIQSAATSETVALGSKNVGPKIDDVLVQNLTDATTLFSDDFEEELDNSGVVTCPTPDPADSKAAIPTAALDICEKLAKIMMAFPQNVYDVAAFEFNSAGSGFSACLKAWICNPSSDLVEENGGLIDLLAYYAHNEASGQLLDSHTGLHHLTEDGGTLASGSGKVSGSRVYGTGEVALIADEAWHDLDGSFSIGGWVNMATLGVNGDKLYLYSKRDGALTSDIAYCAFLENISGVIYLNAYSGPDGLYTVPGFSSTATWYFWCIRYDATLSKMVFDIGIGSTLSLGDFDASSSLIDPPVSKSVELVFGGTTHTGSNTDTLQGGMMDEVFMYERCLTDAQVTLIFNGGSGIQYSQLTS